ncbi:uncharacterized protein RCO7_05272 [Rhynchosporium graminicola]|uniref:DUF1996 domain-containing protein n=1 Tax=Rhynchosporium graminicola TaxID=2792576 RepID=A0A1E1LRZ6_9HELO|nr:uncharacterized protein RCO7_05272 [Rhynchosporium commune]
MCSGEKNDISDTAICTSCFFPGDFSNNWTVVLHLRAQNGTCKCVPIFANAQLEESIDGMTIYNTRKDFNLNGSKKIISSPLGLRMTVETVAILPKHV